MSYLNADEAYDYATLACWYQNSVDETQPPIWTDEHLEELLKDFYVIPKDTPIAEVVPKSEVEELEQELTNMLVSEQTELPIPMEYVVRVRTEHPIYKAIKAEVAKEIFAEILNIIRGYSHSALVAKNNYGATQAEYIGIDILELKKKYTEDSKQ